MDPMQQLWQKINAEQTFRQQHPAAAPPPYTPSESDNDMDDDTGTGEATSSPVKMTINAAHSIQGSNNLVPTSATPLADANKFGALLLAAVKQMNTVAEAAGPGKRPIRVDLTINCGVTVIGDRNVVGNVGLKPKSPAHAIAGPGARMSPPSTPTAAGLMAGDVNSELVSPTVAGAKRKAGEDEEEMDGRGGKRVAL